MKTLIGISVAAIIFALGSSAEANTLLFADDFNRPDSSVVGNGWLESSLHGIADLEIKNGVLTNRNSDDVGAVYRPVPFNNPIRIKAVLTDSDGSLLVDPGFKYEHHIRMLSNGQPYDGFGILIRRTDSAFSNSAVVLWDNGQNLGTVFSPFQFGSSLTLDVTFSPSGSVVGTIADNDTGEVFNFDFPESEITSNGDNFLINLELNSRNPALNFQSIDDLILESVNEVAVQFPVDTAMFHTRAHGHGSLNFYAPKTRPDDPWKPHFGEDWNSTAGGDNDYGSPVYAIADGTIVAMHDFCRVNCAVTPPWYPEGTGGWGRTILIEHQAPVGKYFVTDAGRLVSKVYSLYGHLAAPGDTQPTDKKTGLPLGFEYEPELDAIRFLGVSGAVRKGEIIGQIGNGQSPLTENEVTWPSHLHFEVLLEDHPVSDELYQTAHRTDTGYGWDLSTRTDPSEFIEANKFGPTSALEEVKPGHTVIVHTYGTGQLSHDFDVPLFRLNGQAPFRGVIGRFDDKGKEVKSNDPCDQKHDHGEWRRVGCAKKEGKYRTDHGYNGEYFSLPVGALSEEAEWLPRLPSDGRYSVSVFVPATPLGNTNGIADYVLSYADTMVEFSIDQMTLDIVIDGVDVEEPEEASEAGQEKPYGWWIHAGNHPLKANQEVSLIMRSPLALKNNKQMIAADAVRFVFLGQQIPNVEDPTIWASSTFVQAGTTIELSWNTGGHNDCQISGPGTSGITTVDENGTLAIVVTNMSTFTISCNGGTASASVIVRVVPIYDEN